MMRTRRTISAPPYSYNRTVRGFIRGLIVLHRAFRSRDLRTRAHALVRFLTCPFLRVVRYVPAGARVLDIGAGHGVFSVLAADGGARVVAVEPDVRKVLAQPPHPPSAPSPPLSRGRRALDSTVSRDLSTEASPSVRFVAGYDDVVRGAFDVVAI